MIVCVDLTNTGTFDGKKVVQLYIRDLFTSPLKELKSFQKIALKKGEMQTVKFEISEEDLKFYDSDLQFDTEFGAFHVFVGMDSNTENKVSFELVY